MKRFRRLAALMAIGALATVAAACGDDDEEGSDTTAAAVTSAAAPTDAPTTQAPAATPPPETDAPETSGAETTEPPATDAPETSDAVDTTDTPDTTAGEDAEPVSLKVGVAAPLSGPFVALGESAVQGIELAVDELADQGVTIDLVVEDTASDPQTTLNAFTKLISQDQVDAILGTLCSSCNTAATQVLEEGQIPQLTIGEGSSSGCDASDLVVCVVEDSASRVAAIQSAAEDMGATSVGIIQSELSAPGAEVTEALQAALPEAGIEVNVALAAADAQDFRAQLTSIRDAELIVVAGAAAAQSGIVLRNMEDLGMEQQVVGLIWSADILNAASEDFVSEHYLFTAAFVAADPAAADFAEAFAAAHDGKAPDKYAATAYTSTMLLANGAREAGTTDGPALRAAIETVQIDSPLGASAIEDGVWRITARLAQFRDGQQVFVD